MKIEIKELKKEVFRLISIMIDSIEGCYLLIKKGEYNLDSSWHSIIAFNKIKVILSWMN